MNMLNAIVGSIVFASVSAASLAGVSDFYVAGGQGTIFLVDGNTLQANEVFSVNGGLAINDIIFVGDNKMLANVTDQLIQYDMITGEETVIFDVVDQYGKEGHYFTSGFAGTDDNEIFFSVMAFTDDGIDQYGAIFDPFEQSFRETASIDLVPGLYFDHLEVGENQFLGADFMGQQVNIIDSLTGDTLVSYDVGFGPVSFVELDGLVFMMSKEGDMYSFDVENGSTKFFGSIGGVSENLLGAASTEIFRIPSPGSLPLLGLGTLVAIRRRR